MKHIYNPRTDSAEHGDSSTVDVANLYRTHHNTAHEHNGNNNDSGNEHSKNPIGWSGKRGSNPRPSAWEANALPTELLPRFSTAKIIIIYDLTIYQLPFSLFFFIFSFFFVTLHQ